MKSRKVRFDIRRNGKPLLIGLVVWLVMCLAFLFVFVRPKARELWALEKASEPRLKALSALKDWVEEQEAFLAALQQAEADLERLRSELLTTREQRLVDIHRELDRLGREFHIPVSTVNFNNDRLEDEALDRHAMVVPLEGGYAALRKFLQAVESTDTFLVVEQVALGEGKEGGVMLQLNITLTTYFDDMEAREDPNRRPGRRRRKA